MIEELDLKQLSTMTAFLKAESESASEFTIEFLECLLTRYNLDVALFEELELEGVPEEIIKIIQSGKVPTKEDLLPLDSGEQNILIMELIWFCGMHRIAVYTEDEEVEEGEDSTLDRFIVLREVSPSHWIGSYLIAALTLLMCRIPSDEYIDRLTNNFDESQENVEAMTHLFLETCSCLYQRYSEDDFFYQLKPKSEDE